MPEYKDITYEVGANAVRITINRPEVMNAFRLQTVEELIDAFKRADEEKSVNTIVFAGAGDKAFCTGGDQKVHLSEDGLYGPRGTVGMPIEEMQTALRDLRKVSIAKVQGFAIGGGNVFATMCDLTIASEKATFGQVGPKVGSVDPGWGTAYNWDWNRCHDWEGRAGQSGPAGWGPWGPPPPWAAPQPPPPSWAPGAQLMWNPTANGWGFWNNGIWTPA